MYNNICYSQQKYIWNFVSKCLGSKMMTQTFSKQIFKNDIAMILNMYFM